MTEKLNYLRFMSYKEFQSYLNGEPIRCHKSWREGEPPMFYFFGVKESSLDDIDLMHVLDIQGYAWIESAMAYDLCYNLEPRYEIAILFKGDGSLEEEEFNKNISCHEHEFKAESYNHLKWLDIRFCSYYGGRGAEIELEIYAPAIASRVESLKERKEFLTMATMP